MALNDKQKKQMSAIVRGLKDQKGITLKQSELNQDLVKINNTRDEILKIKAEHADIPAVQEKADEELKRLQSIVNELNEYMSILHPQGLIDFSGGGAVATKG